MMEVKIVVSADAASASDTESASEPRRAYDSPVLLKLGDVRDFTLGGSQGPPESTNPPSNLP